MLRKKDKRRSYDVRDNNIGTFSVKHAVRAPRVVMFRLPRAVIGQSSSDFGCGGRKAASPIWQQASHVIEKT